MKILISTFLTYYTICFTPSNAEATPQNQRCLAMPQEGEDCNVSLTQWYYDNKEGKCKTFQYGDCPQSNNTFNSEGECNKTCMTATAQPTGTGHIKGQGDEEESGKTGQQSGEGIPLKPKEVPKKLEPTGSSTGIGGGEAGSKKGPGTGEGSHPKNGSKEGLRKSCSVIPEEGNCEGLKLWYYNKRRARCRKFRSGDCEGNHKFFTTKDECLDTCQGKQGTPRRTCFAMPEEGDCDYVDRWYYNTKRNVCKRFADGDCEGDNAFFKTKAECVQICQDASNEPESTVHTKGGEEEAPAPSTSGHGKKQKQEKGEVGSKQTEGASNGKGKTGHVSGGEGEAPLSNTTGQGGKEDKKGELKGAGVVTTKRPENITLPGPIETPPMSTTSKGQTMTEAKGTVAEAKRRQEQRRKELEAKRKHRSRKPQIKGSCGSRPRKGTCDGDAEKWWFDGTFRVCNKVTQGQCTNHATFFDTCRDCMNRCFRRQAFRCKYWE
ncbi:uncharacterized protein [Dermacentor andersoni]|uniref:uncharacterized protein isoform X3 n=1 Tax=Dermacentor andersoni TaxID=34620 RepID=UPI003B3BD072